MSQCRTARICRLFLAWTLLGALAAVEVDLAIPAYQPAPGLSGTIASIGSDTLNTCMAYWAETFQTFHPQVSVSMEAKGSSTAMPALIAGTAQLGPMSRLPKPEEIAAFTAKFGYPPTSIAVAIDCLAVYVHPDNPLTGLTLQQVDGIFSATRKRGGPDISTWGQLGLGKAWERRVITLYGRNSASGTYGFFKESALNKGDFKSTVQESRGGGLSMASDPAGIGYAGFGYLTTSLKVLNLGDTPDQIVTPTYDHCLDGSYPLTRRFYIAVNKAPGKVLDPLTAQFLALVVAREGQEIVLKDGYFPLSPALAAAGRVAAGLDAPAAGEPVTTAAASATATATVAVAVADAVCASATTAVPVSAAAANASATSASASSAALVPESTNRPNHPVPALTGTLVSQGSDTLNNCLTYWAEGFQAIHTKASIAIEGKGGVTAPPALTSGRSQIGPMTRPMNPAEIAGFVAFHGYPPTAITVAIDALVVIVHPDNPLTALTMAQVDGIFSSTRRRGGADLDNWGLVGLGGEWAARTIAPCGRNSASGSYGFFKQVALHRDDFRASVSESPGSVAVVRAVAENPAAIGYAGVTYATGAVKPLALSPTGNVADAVAPTVANCTDGSYPLARRFYLYINKAPGKPLDPLLSAFIAYVLSPEGQAIVAKDGHLPITSAMVAEGRITVGLDAAVGADTAADVATAIAALPHYRAAAGLSGTFAAYGSDYLNNCMTAWAEEFQSRNPDIQIGIEGHGGGGPERFLAGVVDLCPMSRRLKPSEIATYVERCHHEPGVIVVAFDCQAVIVHRDHALAGISLAQLDGMFSATRKRGGSDLATWGQLGLDGPWATRDIVVVGRNSASGAKGYFKEQALQRGDFKPTVRELAGASAVIAAVAADPAAIGYTPLGSVTDAVKSLAIGEPGQEVAPTYADCVDGTYPLARQLVIYFDSNPEKPLPPVLREFLIFVISQEGQALVAKDGLLPITPAILAQDLAALQR